MTFQSRHEFDTIDLTNDHGLMFLFFPHGDLLRVTCGDILINQVLGSPLEGSLNNVYLRLKSPQAITFTPLVGAVSPSTFAYGQRQAVWQGEWEELAYTCTPRWCPTHE